MATKLQIVNRALQMLGAKRITALNDPVKEALEMDACYTRVLEGELRAHNWRFATRRFILQYEGGGTLTAWSGVTTYSVGDVVSYDDGLGERPFYCVSDAPATPPSDPASWYPLVPYSRYLYAFALPADCLRVIQFGAYFPSADLTDYVQVETADYTIERGFVLCDSSQNTPIRYIRREENTEVYDSNFCEMLSCSLAKQAAETITASDSIYERLNRGHKEALIRAIRANAIELPPSRIADDTWMVGRL